MMQMAVGSRRFVRWSVLAALLVTGIAACSGDSNPVDPGEPPPPPTSAVLLKDVVLSHLPSPYYHFDYDLANRAVHVTFASEIRNYLVSYDGSRIREMHSLIGGDRLLYAYDGDGRVSNVRYVDVNGVEYVRVLLAYTGPQLTGIERRRLIDGGFVVDKETALTYDPDGNLLDLTVHRPAIAGQQEETTTSDRYEQYDDKLNVDGFSLIHDEFNDHLVLLPDVQFQHGNPGRQVHTGDGSNFEVTYQYDYDMSGRPTVRHGALTFTSGPDAGKVFALRSDFSYY